MILYIYKCFLELKRIFSKLKTLIESEKANQDDIDLFEKLKSELHKQYDMKKGL